MSEVWDEPDGTGAANVRMFVSQLRRELTAASGRAGHIVTEPSVGYRFVPQERGAGEAATPPVGERGRREPAG